MKTVAKEIHDQHDLIDQQIRDAKGAIQRRASFAFCRQRVIELRNNMRDHFAYEEKIMTEKYPIEQCEEHLSEHAKCLVDMTIMLGQANTINDIEAILDHFTTWIEDHIEVYDNKFKPHT